MKFEGEPPAARELPKSSLKRKRVAVIPPRSNRNVQFEYDRYLYKERHTVENFFQRLKRYRKLGVFL
jgi:transposase